MLKISKSQLLVIPLAAGVVEIAFPKDNSILRGVKVKSIEVIPDAIMDKSVSGLLNSTDAQLKTIVATFQVAGSEDVKMFPLNGLAAKNYSGMIREFDDLVINWDQSKILLNTALGSLSAGACVILNIQY